VATRRQIPSIGERRKTTGNDSASRGYFGLKPEAITTPPGRARSEQRQHRYASELAPPRDRGSRDTATTWRQSELDGADVGAPGRRARQQSAANVVKRSEKQQQQQQQRRRAVHDANSAGCDGDVARRSRLTNDVRKKQTDGDGDYVTIHADITDSLIDADRPVAVGVPQTELKVFSTQLTAISDKRRVDKGSRRNTEGKNGPTSPANEPGYSHPPNSARLPRRMAKNRSAAAVVATTKQIWWPYLESSDEEELNNADDDNRCNGADDDDDADDANVAVDDSAKPMSWPEIDASFVESIRELDSFLLQQDSDLL